jgi:hypothetical protein
VPRSSHRLDGLETVRTTLAEVAGSAHETEVANVATVD